MSIDNVRSYYKEIGIEERIQEFEKSILKDSLKF